MGGRLPSGIDAELDSRCYVVVALWRTVCVGPKIVRKERERRGMAAWRVKAATDHARFRSSDIMLTIKIVDLAVPCCHQHRV